MPLTINLPQPLDEELTLEAKREGVPATDHATVLLYLASALLTGEAPTPFQEAVKGFLVAHSLDANRVSSVFEELVRLCLKAHEEGGAVGAFEEPPDSPVSPGSSRSENLYLPHLIAWRNAMVHRRAADDQPSGNGSEAGIADLQPSKEHRQRPGRKNMERPSAFGKYAGIIPSSEEFMREKQQEIAREDGREE